METETGRTNMTQTVFRCPGCDQMVDEAFYKEHIQGDAQNGPHKLHIINITGVGTQMVPQAQTRQPVFMDIPYFGRVRRDAFIVYSLFLLLLGVLMGARII